MDNIILESRERTGLTHNETSTLEFLQTLVENAVYNALKNGKEPKDVPVFIMTGDGSRYSFDSGITSFGRKPFGYCITMLGRNKIEEYSLDERPACVKDDITSDFWDSRGPSSFDVSGFVVSKQAGERILKLVQYVLGKTDIKTFLDYREYEPTWIQFKFDAEEFDVEKLDELTRKNDNIINLSIINECKK